MVSFVGAGDTPQAARRWMRGESLRPLFTTCPLSITLHLLPACSLGTPSRTPSFLHGHASEEEAPSPSPVLF